MGIVTTLRRAVAVSSVLAIVGHGGAQASGDTQQALANDTGAPSLRLPEGVRPTRQAVDLALDPQHETFSGTTVIAITVDRPAPVIWLHARQLKLSRAVLEGASGSDTLEVIPGSEDVIGLRRPRAAVGAGQWTLRIDYDGVISRRDTEGLFAQESGGDWYLFTQFEPLGARRAFPCFDEPGFKIPWRVTLHVPQALQAFSNGPERSRESRDGRAIVSFAETPPLPSYLVAVAVGPFDIVDAGRAGRKHTPLRVLVPRGRGAEAAHAVRVTPRILEWLEDYFGTAYPFDKLDQVAVPSFGGAMENAGLITFSELLLLQKPGQDTLEAREWYLKVAAHEVAHNWFGNLVTMAWWDDLWLNEGFASWMHQRVAEELAPDLNLRPGAVSDRSMALEADALSTARQVRQPITSHHDIAGAFDGITYMKGQAILQMVEGWLGREVFRNGVRRYLATHAGGNATSADFVSALSEAAGRELSGVFRSFLDQPGAPVISVSLTCGTGAPRVELQQRSYRPLGGGEGAAKTWHVPVCVESRSGDTTERTCTVLRQGTGLAPLNAPTCPNAVLGNHAYTGYYRTLHAPDVLERLVADGEALSAEARQGLLLDLKALVQSGDETAARALAVARAFAADENRHVGLAVVSTVGWLRSFVPDTHTRPYERFVRALFASRAKQLGWRSAASDTPDVRSVRGDVVRAAGIFGADDGLREEAVALARTWLEDDTAIEADMVSAALAVAASSGDTPLFEAFRRFLVETQDRPRRAHLLGALSFAGSPQAATVLLPLVRDARLEPMDAVGLAIALSRAPSTRAATLQYVMAHYDSLVARLPQGSTFDGAAMLLNVGAPICEQPQRDEFQKFFANRVEKIAGGPRQLAQVLEGIDACIAQRRTIAPSIVAYLAAQPAHAPRSARHLVGTWVEDRSQSKVAPSLRAPLRFEAASDGTLEELRGPEASPSRQPVRLDERPTTLQDGSTTTWTKVDASTLKQVRATSQGLTRMRTLTVAPDRLTVTEVVEVISGGRTVSNVRATYRRAGPPRPGLAGRWEPVSMEASPLDVTIALAGENMLRISSSYAAAFDVTLDGLPTNPRGAATSEKPLMTRAARLLDDGSLELREFRNGIEVVRSVMTVSADGTTLTDRLSVDGSAGAPQPVVVFRKQP